MTPTHLQKKILSSKAVSLPEEFREEIARLIPKESEEIEKALNEKPEVSIRYNRRKSLKKPVFENTSPVAWCGSGVYLPERRDFVHDPIFHAGAYYVQEAASMIYEQIIEKLCFKYFTDEKEKPLNLLDLCAAPGGKTTAMLNSLPMPGTIVANEYDRKRAGILKENLDKWGDGRVIITNSDASSFGQLKAIFDIITVDAPCSGEGLMRREPVAKAQWSRRLVESCSALQKDIVGNILPALKPGGFLIYSTCTFNRRENEDNVKFLIERFGLEVINPLLVGAEDAENNLSHQTGGLENTFRFMPHKVKCEGLFLAVLRKPFEDVDIRRTSGNLKNKTEKYLSKTGEQFYCVTIGDSVYALPESTMNLFNSIKTNKKIRIISAGTELYNLKGKLRIPSPRSVLNPDLSKEFPQAEIDMEKAVAYLKKEPFLFDSEMPVGYVTLTYQGLPIGIVKNLGSRVNNLYPSEWRVRT